jgi:NADPH:quinone reductase
MRAAVIVHGRIEVEDVPDPVPGPGEILIRVRAAGINRADLMQRAGNYPPPQGTTEIPGLECAGETEDGRRVMALLPGGGHAELVAVHESHVLPVPKSVEWPPAGGFMEAFATAHDALFTQCQLQAGERLLVNGAAGGVGIAGVQLGSEQGAVVTAFARHHQRELEDLGATNTEPEGLYNVILELVGGELIADDMRRLATLGRLSLIGTGAGSRVEVEFGYLLRARGRIHGSHLRGRSVKEKAEVVRRLGEDVLPLLAEGRVIVPVHATYRLEQAQEAYEAFDAGGKFGKIVLVM